MNPIAEELLRIIALGRGKDAALARMALRAEGLVVEAAPLGLSMSPAAIRQRNSRANRRRSGSTAPVTGCDSVTEPSLSLSSDLQKDPGEEREAGDPVTGPVTAVTGATGDEFPNENESSVRAKAPTAERDRRSPVTRAVTLDAAATRISASDPLTNELRLVAADAGVTDPEAVWRKFTAWNDGKSKAMPRDWRIWCLREREKQPGERRAEAEAPEAPRVKRANEGPVTLIPESECPPADVVDGYLQTLEETLKMAGRGGVRKAPIPPAPGEARTARREAAS